VVFQGIIYESGKKSEIIEFFMGAEGKKSGTFRDNLEK
jgi:hypothetical protein